MNRPKLKPYPRKLLINNQRPNYPFSLEHILQLVRRVWIYTFVREKVSLAEPITATNLHWLCRVGGTSNLKSLKHNHRSCAISIFIFKSILFACEIEYLDNLNSSRCDHRHNHFSSFLHLITGGLVRDVPFMLTSFGSCHSTRHWQTVECYNCDELCFRITNAHYCSDLLKLVQYCPSHTFPISFQLHVKTSPLNIILPWRFFWLGLRSPSLALGCAY